MSSLNEENPALGEPGSGDNGCGQGNLHPPIGYPKTPPAVNQNPAVEALEMLRDAGLLLDSIDFDGRLHRVPTAGKPGSKDAAYIAHADSPMTVWWQNWATGETGVWTAKGQGKLTMAERETLAKRREEDRMEREAEQARIRSGVAAMAASIYASASSDGVEDNGYLLRKGVKPVEGLKVSVEETTIGGVTFPIGSLVVPMRDEVGDIASLQFIDTGGNKRFLRGGRKQGCLFPIGGKNIEGLLMICEGLATALSLFKCIGHTTLTAFDAGNLRHAAEIGRRRYPHREIVICADFDESTEQHPNPGGIGVAKATEAAMAVGGYLAIPSMDGAKCDWNDLHLAEGVEAVRAQFADRAKPEQQEPLRDENSVTDVAGNEHDSEQQESPKLDARKFTLTRLDQIETKPPEWLVHELLTINSLAVIFADPEAGKSFLAVDLAASVATGETFFHQDTRQSAVIYINGEGQEGIKRRFDAWEIKRQTSLKGTPIFLSNITTDLTDPDSVAIVESAVDEIVADYGNPGLIVIDTLNRNFGPADENSTADMTKFVAGLDQLRMKYQAALLVVHHTGHANKERGRGSMVLHGGVDSEYCLTKNGDLIQMKCSKMKDFSRPLPMTFKLEIVELPMIDEYGLQVTSAVLELTDYVPRPKATSAGKGKNQVKALEILQELIASRQETLESAGHGSAGARVTVDDWREKCKARGVNKDRFWEIKKSLEEQCFVSIENGFAVIANGATETIETIETGPKQDSFGRQDEGDRNDRNKTETTEFRSRTPTETTETPYKGVSVSVTSSSVGPDRVEI